MNVAYRYGLAGLLHDIGKLSQRAQVELTPETCALRDRGWHTKLDHKPWSYLHALHTRQFFDEPAVKDNLADIDPPESSIANLASLHHNPSTPGQWIIAMADRLSAGFDRMQRSPDEDSPEKMDFRKTYQHSIFETIALKDERRQGISEYRYPLLPLSEASSSLFPVKKNEIKPSEEQLLDAQHRKLWDGFMKDVKRLATRASENPLQNYAEWMTVLEQYTWCVASSTQDTPDVSLYDHSVTTGGIAAVLAQYHERSGTWNVSAIKDMKTKKFRLVAGDVSGIQKFILGLPTGETKRAAVQLRARSFFIGALSRAVVLALLKELELPPSVLLREAAGQFLLLAPNLDSTRQIVAEFRQSIDRWLLGRYFGEVSFNLDDRMEACGDDFEVERFHKNILRASNQSLERMKSAKFHTGLQTESGKWNPESFVLKSHYPKNHQIQEGDLGSDNLDSYYRVLKELEKIGRVLPSTAGLVWRTEPSNSNRSLELPFDISVDLLNKDESGNSSALLWENLEYNSTGALPAVRRLPNHIAVFTDRDLSDGECRLCKSHQLKSCLIDDDESEPSRIYAGTPRTFQCLGRLSLEEIDGQLRGREMIGILKADVDNLGLIFGRGLRRWNKDKWESTASVSRYAMLSRMLNHFFVGHLQELMHREDCYRYIYTVYAGGDDLFLVGPWRTMIRYAVQMNADFREYTCHNPDITISAGLFFCKPSYPIRRAAIGAEEALEQSKQSGKNRLTLFGTTILWDEMLKLIEWRDFFFAQHQNEDSNVNNSFLYRVLTYSEMANESEQGNLRGILFHPHMIYDIGRNIKKWSDKQLKNKDEVKQLQGLAANKELLKKINIPVCEVLYRFRGGHRHE